MTRVRTVARVIRAQAKREGPSPVTSANRTSPKGWCDDRVCDVCCMPVDGLRDPANRTTWPVALKIRTPRVRSTMEVNPSTTSTSTTRSPSL